MSRYTLVVGTQNWSSWSLRPYLALRATGVEFETVVINLRQPDTRANIAKFSPSGQVPALLIEQEGNSFTVFDSLAICETLAERHAEARLWPKDATPRAHARALSAAMHSGFAAIRATLPMDFVRRIPTPAINDEVKDQIALVFQYWGDALTRFGAKGGFLFGYFSIADCMYAPVLSRFRTYGIELPSHLIDYSRLVFSLPAMRDWERAAQLEVDSGLA
jgi:glutathione S-transferase